MSYAVKEITRTTTRRVRANRFAGPHYERTTSTTWSIISTATKRVVKGYTGYASPTVAQQIADALNGVTMTPTA